MKYEAVIFDIDDTLFDYTKTEKFALYQTCRYFNIENKTDLYNIYKLANNEAKNLIDLSNPKNLVQFRVLRADIFISSIVDRLNKPITPSSFVDIYLSNSVNGILIEGVSETLQCLSNVKKVAATNGSDYPRKNKLESSSIAPLFSRYYSSEVLGVSKPDPTFFEIIIKDIGLPKSKCLIIGDNYEADIEGARAGGIDCCWFNYKDKVNQNRHGVTEVNKFNQILGLFNGEQ